MNEIITIAIISFIAALVFMILLLFGGHRNNRGNGDVDK